MFWLKQLAVSHAEAPARPFKFIALSGMTSGRIHSFGRLPDLHRDSILYLVQLFFESPNSSFVLLDLFLVNLGCVQQAGRALHNFAHQFVPLPIVCRDEFHGLCEGFVALCEFFEPLVNGHVSILASAQV